MPPRPDERDVTVGPYELAMMSVFIETEAMMRFADGANYEWDSREAALAAAGKTAQRNALHEETERKLTALTQWTLSLSDEVREGALVPHDYVPSVAVLDAVGSLNDDAAAMLAAFRKVASGDAASETARRASIEGFMDDAAGLEGAALAAAGLAPAPGAYESEVIRLRLAINELVLDAQTVNTQFDEGEIRYARSKQLMADVVEDIHMTIDEVVAVDPPEAREALYGLALAWTGDFVTAADTMLEGLLLSSKEEEVPGTIRRTSMAELRVVAQKLDRAMALAFGAPAGMWEAPVPAPGPHLAPPDTEAPGIQVTSPRGGATVAAKTVTVTGTAEPGAAISSGSRTTTVEPDGSWSIKVTLSRGKNNVKITATDLSGNATTVTHVLRRGYELRADGIGPVDGGDDPDEVVAAFTEIFGRPPDRDVMADDPLEWGWWAESYMRRVSWNDKLVLFFGDGGYFHGDGRPELLFWATTNTMWVTPEGIYVGSTGEELSDAYGARLWLDTEGWGCTAIGDWVVVKDGGGWQPYLRGRLSEPEYTSSARVESLSGGYEASC